jgi:hypothetical protein
MRRLARAVYGSRFGHRGARLGRGLIRGDVRVDRVRGAGACSHLTRSDSA